MRGPEAKNNYRLYFIPDKRVTRGFVAQLHISGDAEGVKGG
jgi:hypothetical protein